MSSSFDISWNAAILKSKKNIDKILRETVEEVFSSIIEDTPIKTGALKGNWIASIGSPSSDKTGTLDRMGDITVSNMRKEIRDFKTGDTVYLVNTLEYAERIEYGYSGQAPYGMVRVNIVRFDTILSSKARKNKDT